ncbi:PREDICTED: uncharacterized protein LOC105567517 isoform X2 [Vollenhovia emeryi]|nr:PREDICTED: uncharacterized protein LOC105567517 isoform X2 [Vollenhovia emeryi]
MNLVAFGLILICCNAWAARTKIKGLLREDNRIQDFFKRLKTTFKTGNESLGIPVLDPFHADRLQFNVDEDVVNFRVNTNFTNINAYGFSEYDVVNSTEKMLPPSLNLHILWPLLSLNADYSMDAKYNYFNIYGKGTIKISLENLDVDAKMDLTLTGGRAAHVRVKDIKFKISTKSLDFQMTGLMDDAKFSAAVSAAISDMAPDVLNNDTILDLFNHHAKKILTYYLSTKTIYELTDIIYT